MSSKRRASGLSSSRHKPFYSSNSSSASVITAGLEMPLIAVIIFVVGAER